MKTLLSCVGMMFCATLAASAGTASLKPSADTTLFQNFPDNNMGAVPTLAAGTTAHDFFARALIKFDAAGQVPANMVITSARLRLQVVREPLGPQPSTFTLRRMLRDWSEGSKALSNVGAPAQTGEATWNNRFHPATGWSTPGGAPDVDFSSAVSSSAPVGDLGTVVFETSPEMIADVQTWLNNPNQNFGWMLVSESEDVNSTARRFGAKEDAANAPVLEIEFAPPFRIEDVALSGGIFRFSFPVEPLFTYTVESRGSLAGGTWNVLTNFTEKFSSYGAAISDTTNGVSSFYRVIKAPCNCR